MQIDRKMLARGTVVIGLGVVLDFVPTPKLFVGIVAGVELAIAFIESVKRDDAECGVSKSSGNEDGNPKS